MEDAAAAILNIVKKIIYDFQFSRKRDFINKRYCEFLWKIFEHENYFQGLNEKQFDLIADNLNEKFLCSPQKDFKKSISDIEKYIENNIDNYLPNSLLVGIHKA